MSLTTVDQGLLGTYAQYTGFKNRIINGAMGIWQRGTSGFTSSGNYSADRFIVSTGTSLSAVGQSSDVPSGFKYSISVAGTNQTSIRQYIESVNCTDLVGQSITVSFWLKQSTGAGSNAMYIYLAYANSADNFSGLTQIGSAVNITTTSSWAQYTATFTNLPAGAANGVALLIGSNSAGSTTYLVTGVQLEKGSTATSFDYRPYGTELQLCQRYFSKLSNTSAFLSGYNSTNNYISSFLGTPATMRAVPTVSVTGAPTVFNGYEQSFIAVSTNTVNWYIRVTSGGNAYSLGDPVISLSSEL